MLFFKNPYLAGYIFYYKHYSVGEGQEKILIFPFYEKLLNSIVASIEYKKVIFLLLSIVKHSL